MPFWKRQGGISLINLIENEIVKILKKKSFYIILMVTVLFMIFYNFITTKSNTSMYSHYGNYSDNYVQHMRDYIKELNPERPEDVTAYIETKSLVECFDLVDKYGGDTWQAYIIMKDGIQYTRNLYLYAYGSEKDDSLREKAQTDYEAFVALLDKDDWRYFVEQEKQKLEEEMKIQEDLKAQTKDSVSLESIQTQINYLSINKQVLDWRLEKNISYGYDSMNDNLNQYIYNKSMCFDYENKESLTYEEKQEYQQALKTAETAKYRIEKGEPSEKIGNFQYGMTGIFSNYEMFIIIILVMISGTIVSEEFNKGTVILLLVRPYSRTKILLAKWIACVLIFILAILGIAIAQFVIGGILFGWEGVVHSSIIQYDFNLETVVEFTWWQYLGILFITKLPLYLLVMTIAFALSTIFTNSAFAIVIALLGYMSTSIINALATAYQIDILRYFITMNWNIDQYLFGALPSFEGMTLAFSIMVCILYFLVLMIASILVFKKKNIKNI